MEDARDDGIVFGGVTVARELREHPLRGFAIVGDSGRTAVAVDKKTHLIADLFPLRVREAYQDSGAGTEVGEGDVVAELDTIGAAEQGEHGGETGSGDEVSATHELVGQKREVSDARWRRDRRVDVDTVHGHVGGAQLQGR